MSEVGRFGGSLEDFSESEVGGRKPHEDQITPGIVDRVVPKTPNDRTRGKDRTLSENVEQDEPVVIIRPASKADGRVEIVLDKDASRNVLNLADLLPDTKVVVDQHPLVVAPGKPLEVEKITIGSEPRIDDKEPYARLTDQIKFGGVQTVQSELAEHLGDSLLEQGLKLIADGSIGLPIIGLLIKAGKQLFRDAPEVHGDKADSIVHSRSLAELNQAVDRRMIELAEEAGRRSAQEAAKSAALTPELPRSGKSLDDTPEVRVIAGPEPAGKDGTMHDVVDPRPTEDEKNEPEQRHHLLVKAVLARLWALGLLSEVDNDPPPEDIADQLAMVIESAILKYIRSVPHSRSR